MGSESQAKFVRKQVKNVIKEVLPDVLAGEVHKTMMEQLRKDAKGTLDLVQKLVRDTLEKIDERQKTIQSLMMRELAKGVHTTENVQQQPSVEVADASAPKADGESNE